MSIVAVAALAQDVDLVLEAVDLPAEARLDTRLRHGWTDQTQRGKKEEKVGLYEKRLDARNRRDIWEVVKVAMLLCEGQNLKTLL